MKAVKKAVILAGGLGTRFLPATLGVPKELFPIGDKPILFYHFEECVKSGITDVCMVMNRGKNSIDGFIHPNKELLDILEYDNKNNYLDEYKSVMSKLKITVLIQEKPLGTADAVYTAKDWVNGDPFVVINGDDMFLCDKPATKQLIEMYNKTGEPTLLFQEVEKEKIKNYGCAKLNKDRTLDEIVEKPSVKEAPSNLASLGRYLLLPQIFDCIKNLKKVGREYRLPDAINIFCKKQKINCIILDGDYIDCGSKLEFSKGFTKIMMNNPEFGKDYINFIKDIAKNL